MPECHIREGVPLRHACLRLCSTGFGIIFIFGCLPERSTFEAFSVKLNADVLKSVAVA